MCIKGVVYGTKVTSILGNLTLKDNKLSHTQTQYISHVTHLEINRSSDRVVTKPIRVLNSKHVLLLLDHQFIIR